jgi:hypothetical protein
MAKSNTPRDQQTLQEHPMVKELLAELQAIKERRQSVVRWHTLMNQPGHFEIPVLRFHARKEEKIDDYRRGTKKSHRRRISH